MPATSLRVLLVEDDPDHALLIEVALEGASLTQFELTNATSLVDAKAALAEKPFDAVLLDLTLPDARAMEGLSQIKSVKPDMPVVLLTGIADQSMVMEAVRQGAQDYISKDDMNAWTLERVLHYAVERQRMVRQLQESNELLNQKNRRLAELYEAAHQFVDHVSHEFRTPLTVIKEFVTIMRDGLIGQVTAQQREFLDVVNDRTDDLAIMVDDMLDVSKFESGLLSLWRREVAVADVFKHVRSLLERKAAVKKVSFETILPDGLPTVFCDPEKIGRIIINLVANAIKFCGEGGAIQLWARPHRDEREVLIGVTDNGPGIAPEEIERIFDRFHQVEGAARGSTKGFGLGLSIARELAGLNLADLSVQSELGKGSTFYFGVPEADPCELAVRCLKHQNRRCGESPYTTLVTAETPVPAEKGLSTVVDEFLQHVFHANDLVIRVSPNRWLILVRCGVTEIEAMLNRVRSVTIEANRNRPLVRLPYIAYDTKGTWNAVDEGNSIIEAFRGQLKQPGVRPASPRVLLVDDDQETIRGLAIRLAATGYDVLTANDARSAIRITRQERPDAVLMDNYMPGMDGVDALLQFKDDDQMRLIPIILFSASPRDQQKALDRGASFFLQKPFDAKTVMAALREVLDPSGIGAAAP
jgi:signal transduction histidine kinase